MLPYKTHLCFFPRKILQVQHVWTADATKFFALHSKTRLQQDHLIQKGLFDTKCHLPDRNVYWCPLKRPGSPFEYRTWFVPLVSEEM